MARLGSQWEDEQWPAVG